MSYESEKISLYTQGTFSAPNPNAEQQQTMLNEAAGISQSGFGTVILGQWHVHDDGTLYWNDSPINETKWAIQNIPAALKKEQNIKNVFVTFGPFAADFEHIQSNLESFKIRVLELKNNGIDGLDWDLESSYEKNMDLLVELTQWAKSENLLVTAAPYTDSIFWTELLTRTNIAGSTGFSWWNLQCYGGAAYSTWMQYINGLVPNPESFLVPGYSAQWATPDTVKSDIANLVKTFPGLSAGFIWNYGLIVQEGYRAKDYAGSIVSGLVDSPEVFSISGTVEQISSLSDGSVQVALDSTSWGVPPTKGTEGPLENYFYHPGNMNEQQLSDFRQAKSNGKSVTVYFKNGENGRVIDSIQSIT